MHVIILGLCDCEGSKSKNLSKTHSYTSIQTRGCEECFHKPWNLRYFCCCWWLTNLTDSLHETTKDSAIGLVTCDLLPVICLQKTSFLADTTCTWTIFPNRWLSQSKNTATVCRTIHAWNTFDVIFLVWFKLNGLNNIQGTPRVIGRSQLFWRLFSKPFVPWVLRVMPVMYNM